ncbi:MAG: crossover junction endodeoxyribonuclease RuvC [Bacteroidia bacterium]
MQNDKVILGIDPGTNIMGYGLIHIRGKQISLLKLGVLSMNKVDNHGMKLKMIFDCITALIDEFHPDEVAAEAPFFGKNVQSMLKLGRAQGVAMVAALNKNLPVFEYSPRTIKQSITGKGAASKEQVSEMIQRILKISPDQLPKELDASDGLAAALCHYFQKTTESMPVKTKKSGSWAAFALNNPERLKP